MKHLRLLGALSLVALLVPVGALAQTTPNGGPPPPETIPAQVAPYSAAPYPGQTARRGGRHGRGHYLQIVNSLPLSNGQRQQIDQDVAAARQSDQGASKRTKRANRKQLRRQIDSVLTPDQLAQVRSQMAASRGQRQQARPSVAPVPQNIAPGPQNGVLVPTT